jgi:hypothetical protein
MSTSTSIVRGLLRNDAGPGHPPEYLLARLHARRASLAAPPPTAGPPSDDDIWNAFLGELGWLFRQMHPRTRVDYSPLFLLFEMKTIVLCLRNAALERVEPRQRLLERSLLSDGIRDVLGAPRPVGAMVAGLGDALAGLSASFADLDARYFEAGLRGCEDALMRLFLESLRKARLAPPLRQFVSLFIDLRNVMALYKHQRWDLKGPVALIAGGSIAVPALKAIVIKDDRDALDALVLKLTGRPVTADNELSLETALLASLGSQLSASRRARGDAWLVTEYVWSRYVHARNLAVRHHATGIDRATLERELIA